MPVHHSANRRVSRHTDADGRIIKVQAKTQAGRNLAGCEVTEDIYNDYTNHAGRSETGHQNKFYAHFSGGHICDAETLEAYGAALMQMGRDLKLKNRTFAETNNLTPVAT